jgi:3-phytase
MPLRTLTTLILALSLTACVGVPQRDPTPGESPASAVDAQPPLHATVPERWVVEGHDAGELDSLATWVTPEGDVWVVATAKRSHQLQVHAGNDGELLALIGRRGDGPGEFNRPNGIGVHGDLAFVTERDNHRIQVLRLPDFEPLGSFGEQHLQAPYGIWVHELAPNRLEIIITDSFMHGDRYEIVPPLDTLHRRLHRFWFSDLGDGLSAEHRGTFGETSDEGAIRTTESVWGDPLHRRLLVADEHEPSGLRLRVYGLDGGYEGRDLGVGVYRGDPEGIALWACPDGSGYWISTDQDIGLSRFLIYDRESLSLIAAFSGLTTANTDGIVLHAVGSEAFPDGVLYAVHDDRGIAAFDWADIAAALGLGRYCVH